MPPWLLKLLGLADDASEETVQSSLAEKLKAAAESTKANEAAAALGLILVNAAAPAADPEPDDEAKDRADFTGWMHELLGTDPATGVDGLKTALAEKVAKAGHMEKVKKTGDDLNKARDKHYKARSEMETALGNEQTARTTAETNLSNETTARTAAETAFANERKSRTELIVGGLIAAGKLRKADADAKLTELCNAGENFDSTVKTLENAAAVLPTGEAATKDLGKRKGTSATQATVLELVNERMTKTGEDYDRAFAFVRKDKAELFASMQQPAKAN